MPARAWGFESPLGHTDLRASSVSGFSERSFTRAADPSRRSSRRWGRPGPTCAMRTMISAPSSTVWVPGVAVQVGRGEAGLHRVDPHAGERLRVLHGDHVDRGLRRRVGDARVGVRRRGRVGASRVSEARPLLTLTTTGAADRCSSGRKAWVTRTVAEDVGLESVPHHVGGGVRGADDAVRRAALLDAGVVDQHVQAAVGLDGLRRGRDGRVVGDVELRPARAPSCSAARRPRAASRLPT